MVNVCRHIEGLGSLSSKTGLVPSADSAEWTGDGIMPLNANAPKFAAALGLGRVHAEWLRLRLLEAATGEAQVIGERFGTPLVVDFQSTSASGSAMNPASRAGRFDRGRSRHNCHAGPDRYRSGSA
jgi:hypothetical protein